VDPATSVAAGLAAAERPTGSRIEAAQEGDSIITPATYGEMQVDRRRGQSGAAAGSTPSLSSGSGADDVRRVEGLERPPGSAFANRRRAYAAVFATWGVDFTNAETEQIPCDFAPSAGLQCLSEHGNWSEIQRLDLPVILELWDGQDSPYHAALIGMDNGVLHLQLAGQQLETTQRALRDLWSGAYVVLWQTPPGYYGSLRVGQSHETVGWLRRQLTPMVDQSLASPTPNLFDERLREAVLEFQAEEGLQPDGIVGPATWIRLADRLELPQPSLAG
jgi:general secretion pathway protein A